MDLKKLVGQVFWLGVLAVIAIPVFNLLVNTGATFQRHPVGQKTTGYLNEVGKTAFGSPGFSSGGGFLGIGGSSDDAQAGLDQIRQGKELTKKGYHNLEVGEIETRTKLEKYELAQKEAGLVQGWKPLVDWKDINMTTPGPAQVYVVIYTHDPALVNPTNNPLGISGQAASFDLVEGQTANVEDMIVNGGMYIFQAYVGRFPSDPIASNAVGPYKFIQDNCWQSIDGTQKKRGKLTLRVFR